MWTTTSRVVTKTRLPQGVTKEQAIAMLHDTELFIKCKWVSPACVDEVRNMLIYIATAQLWRNMN